MDTSSPALLKWFEGSRCVDGSGRPAVLFHGAPSDFAGDYRASDGNEMRGIYFTDSREEAMEWGQRRGTGQTVIREAVLRISRPAELADLQEVQVSFRSRGRAPSPEAVTRALIRRGFDGYIEQSNSGDALEFVVFSPRQIYQAK